MDEQNHNQAPREEHSHEPHQHEGFGPAHAEPIDHPQPESQQPVPPAPQPAPQPQQPVFAQSPYPAQPPMAPYAQEPVQKHAVDAGLVILQWLTYAFWGWTVLALSALTSIVLSNYIANAQSGGAAPYGIAAVLVLLPISFICDSIYSKKEPQKKTGPETLVMVVHAVLFALFGIGSLIAAVVSMVVMFTSAGASSGAQVVMYCGLIIFVFYALTFLRTLNPSRFPWIKRFYKMFMIVTVGIIALFGIIGPIAKERTLRNDKLIESNLPSVQSAINAYARTNSKLPASLDDLALKNDAKEIVDKKLVVYKRESTGTITKSTTVYTYSAYDDSNSSANTLKYQLCATFTDKSRYYNENAYDDLSMEYSTYVSTYNHDKGEVCYKLQTSSY